MRGAFLNPPKPGQGATFQAAGAAIAEFGLPPGSLSPDAHLVDDLALESLDGIDIGEHPWVGASRRRARADDRGPAHAAEPGRSGPRATVGARRPLRMRLLRGLLVSSVLVATWFLGGARALLLAPAALLALFHRILPRGPAT